MNDNIYIKTEDKIDPDLRKLARALIRIAQEQLAAEKARREQSEAPDTQPEAGETEAA